MTVWALPVPLAATPGITFVFSSSGYLDVSVRRVPLRTLWIRVRIHGVCPCGFPHSEIRGSPDMCSSPRLFAACHVFLRLSVPGHPPCALSCLTFSLGSHFACLLHSVAAFFVFTEFITCGLLILAIKCFTHLLLYLSFKSVPLESTSLHSQQLFLSDRYLGCLHCCLDLQYSVFKVQCLIKTFDCFISH